MKRQPSSSEEAKLAMERDLAAGKLLVDGERVHMMTDEEAKAVFGESEYDLVISPVTRHRGRS